MDQTMYKYLAILNNSNGKCNSGLNKESVDLIRGQDDKPACPFPIRTLAPGLPSGSILKTIE